MSVKPPLALPSGSSRRLGPSIVFSRAVCGGRKRYAPRDGRHKDEDRAEVLVPGEIVEVVVLAEMGPGGRGGVAEEDDRAVLEALGQGGPAGGELLGAEPDPLGRERPNGQSGEKPDR